MSNSEKYYPAEDEMNPIRCDTPSELEALDTLNPLVGKFIGGVIAAAEDNVSKLSIIFEAPNELAGEVHLEHPNGNGWEVKVVGKLGSELPAQQGVLHKASWTGFFYRKANPKTPAPFVADGSLVQKDENIFLASKSKSSNWIVMSPAAGIIRFVAEDGQEVIQGETDLFYLKEQKS